MYPLFPEDNCNLPIPIKYWVKYNWVDVIALLRILGSYLCFNCYVEIIIYVNTLAWNAGGSVIVPRFELKRYDPFTM